MKLIVPLWLVIIALCVLSSHTYADEAVRGKIRIACVGDSITAGARVDAKTQSYPAHLQKLLGEHYEVVNFGIGGATLIKKGKPNVWRGLPRVLAYEPHVVIISLGTNDTVGGNRRNWEKIKDFESDYKDLLTQLINLRTGPAVFLCTPTDMVLETPELSEKRLADLTVRRKRLNELCARIRDIHKTFPRERNIKLIDLNSVLKHKPELLSKGDGVHPNVAGYLAIAKYLLPHTVNTVQRPEGGIIKIGSTRTLEQVNAIYKTMLPVKLELSDERWEHLPVTRKKLKAKAGLKVVMLGDSIINDTSRSAWERVVEDATGCRVFKITSVRGSTGCVWYQEKDRVKTFVTDFAPDLVIIGGISHGKDIQAIQNVISQIKEALPKTEIMLQSGPFGRVDPNDGKWRAEPVAGNYREGLKQLAKKNKLAYLDMQAYWGRYVKGSGQPVESFKRDEVHANEKGEQIVGRILAHWLMP